MTLAEVAAATGGTAFGDARVTGVSTDTRTLQPGDLFVALRGESFDGHAFVAAAREKGAAAAVLARSASGPEGLPFVTVDDTTRALGDLAAAVRAAFTGPVVGVTGSVGKTTVKEMVAAVLETGFAVHRTPANHNNEIGLPQTLFAMPESTGALVLEMGMRGLGQIRRLCEIARPTVGIVTGIGVSHIELLGSREAIADAKSELLQGLPADGVAVFPATDDFADRLRAASPCPVLTVALDAPADLSATDLVRHEKGWRASVATPWGAAKLFVPSPGRFNVQNALLALAAGGVAGLPLDAMCRALLRYEPSGSRLRIVAAASGATVIDDCYNAAPDSMVGALEALMATPVGPSGKRIAVLGEMRELGAHSSEGHATVGRAVARLKPDMLVLVGEATRPLAAAALMDRFPPDAIHTFDRTDQAAQLVPFVVGDGDAVLVKGSRALGMEAIVGALAPEAAPGERT